MTRRTKHARRIILAALLYGTAFSGCWDNDLLRRFREGYAPGFIDGFVQAVSTPGDSEAGLRRTFAALFEGLGSLVTPLPSSSSTSGS